MQIPRSSRRQTWLLGLLLLTAAAIRIYGALNDLWLDEIWALEKYFEQQAWPFALLFSISSVLGFASHLVFLNFFGAAILWSGWRFFKSGLGAKRAVKGMFACHAPPTAFLAAIYHQSLQIWPGTAPLSGLHWFVYHNLAK